MHRPLSALTLKCKRALGRSRSITPRVTITNSFTTTTADETKASARPCDDKKTAAGRIVTPELDQQFYPPEGMGHDPAEQGTWLKPGETAGGDDAIEKKKPAMVHDKLTGEKLLDTEALLDRRSG